MILPQVRQATAPLMMRGKIPLIQTSQLRADHSIRLPVQTVVGVAMGVAYKTRDYYCTIEKAFPR